MCECVCIQVRVHAKINMDISPFPQSLSLLTAFQSCCWHLLRKQPPSYERCALCSLPYLSLSWYHICSDCFLLCVCVPYKEGYSHPHSSGHGAIREVLHSKAQANCRSPRPSERLLWKSSVSQAPLCSLGVLLLLPHMITFWPGHRVLLRDSICLAGGKVTSVLAGGCKYNIMSRSLWLLQEIICIYVHEPAPLSAGVGGYHRLTAPGPWRSPS